MALRLSRRVSRLAAASAAAVTVTAAGLSVCLAIVPAGASAAAAGAGGGFGPGTRFFVPPPSEGAPRQILQLLKSGDRKDAALIAAMEATPRAVWFTSGTPAQVTQQVRQTMA